MNRIGSDRSGIGSDLGGWPNLKSNYRPNFGQLKIKNISEQIDHICLSSYEQDLDFRVRFTGEVQLPQ